jgi:gamma-glutamyltranspeptidase
LEKYQAPVTSAFDDEKEGETTHFSVVDKGGLMVAVTASINAYSGAAAASSELGFLYNTYMNDFTLGEPEHPFCDSFWVDELFIHESNYCAKR